MIRRAAALAQVWCAWPALGQGPRSTDRRPRQTSGGHRVEALVLVLALFELAALPVRAAPLPQRLGQCSTTTVRDLLYRLGTPDRHGVLIPAVDSGSAISYSNGGYQVSYTFVPAIHRSRPGDPVRLCLTFIPDCSQAPPGDRRGRVYAARNLRTAEGWTLPDSQHGCGGA